MLLTIPGIYENGVIKLSETPADLSYSKVLVTILPDEASMETWESLKLSVASFDEWDNEADSVYDNL